MVRAFVLASIAVASILSGWPQPSLAQSTNVDPRWGLLAELAERDFHVDGMGGSHVLYAFRWEDPGRQLSMTFSYVGTEKTLFTLDGATGEILVINARLAPYGEKYGVKVKAAPDGTIQWSNGKPYLARGEGGTFEFGASTLIANQPGDTASQKVEKFVAEGKLRAANAGMRGASAPLSGATAGSAASGSVPALGAPVELNQVQRDALDRYVKSMEITFTDGLNLSYSNWIEPGKSYVVHSLRESAGASEGRYELRPDGMIVMSDDAQERASGLVGQINPSTGQITLDFRSGSNLYRTTVDGVAGQPGITLVVLYQGTQRKRGIEWAEISRSSGAPYSQAQIEATTQQINAQIAMRKSPWGALAALPGKLWYCVGYEPVQWLTRRRMYQGQVGFLDESVPVMRVTLATWREPNRVMEVVTKLGDGHGWTDTITLQPDGTFAMTTTGVAQYANLRGQKLPWGSVVFPIANYNYQNGTASNEIEFDASYPGGLPAPVTMLVVKTDGYGNPTRCTMEPYDESKLQRWTADLKAEQQRSREHLSNLQQARQDFAADAEEGQRMVANMRSELVGTIMSGGGSGPVAYYPPSAPGPYGGGQGGNFLQDLQAMAEKAHREAEQSRARLDATIAQASAGADHGRTGGMAATAQPSSPTGAQAPSSLASSAPAVEKRTVRVFFEAATAPDMSKDDHNTICQSNYFNITMDWVPNDRYRASAAVLDPLMPTFLNKCAAGPRALVPNTAHYYVEGVDPQEPRTLRAGDYQVTMP